MDQEVQMTTALDHALDHAVTLRLTIGAFSEPPPAGSALALELAAVVARAEEVVAALECAVEIERHRAGRPRLSVVPT
jgi:hypothetical protein